MLVVCSERLPGSTGRCGVVTSHCS